MNKIHGKIAVFFWQQETKSHPARWVKRYHDEKLLLRALEDEYYTLYPYHHVIVNPQQWPVRHPDTNAILQPV